MTTSVPALVALCAGAGFLIVWLVFPTKSSSIGDRISQSDSSSGEDDSEPESEEDAAPEVHSTYSGQRPRWCDILHLDPDASPSAIRKAYARLMKGLHPDIAGADEHTTRQCALIQEAYRQAMQDRRAGA
jgi:DnaJ-domain-containing protein 1